VFNQITYAGLFYIELEWLNDVKDFLKTWKIERTSSNQQKCRLVRRVEPFILKNGDLYIMGQYNKLRKCSTTIEAQMVMKNLHEGSSEGCFATEIM
jgi:hypothetical protein